MADVTRRKFLAGSLAAAGTTFFIGGTRASARVLGANDTINVAVAGIRGRGSGHIGDLLGQKNVRITWLVDIDARTFPGAVKRIEDKGGGTPKTVQDVRKALEDKDLDAVSIATPNHWHSLMSIWACQAEKDVYVEKPLSHNVHEGRILVETARKFKRIVQHGTQSRSEKGWATVAAVCASGQLGKVRVSKGFAIKPRGSIGFKPLKDAPPEVDFNIWLGPASLQPYHENLVHYNWHWFWDFGNGEIGNQGVHQMDIMRWLLPGATLPRSVISVGGRFGYDDQGQTPNTQIAVFDYGDRQGIFEVRGLKHPTLCSNDVYLEGGKFIATKFYPKDSEKAAPPPKVDLKMGPGSGPFGNWLAAMRSRNYQDLNADVLEGHLSSALCHIGNISYRLGEDVPFVPRPKVFDDNKEAYEALLSMEDHLTKENNLDLSTMKLRIGRRLRFSPSRERFIGDGEANQLVTRAYREPFVVPEKVETGWLSWLGI